VHRKNRERRGTIFEALELLWYRRRKSGLIEKRDIKCKGFKRDGNKLAVSPLWEHPARYASTIPLS